MKNSLQGLPESFRQTISAGLPLVIVMVLFIFIGNFGISKVIDLRAQIKSAQDTKATLTQKLNILTTVSTTVSTEENSAVSAVPDSNSSLAAISQLKTLAAENGMIISAIKSTSGTKIPGELNEAIISFTVEGIRPQLFSFLTNIATIAPITVVGKIHITETAGGAEAKINATSYWATFPKTIPPVDAPISDLTQSEKDTLSKISGLTQPTFTELTLPISEEVNPNPFGQ